MKKIFYIVLGILLLIVIALFGLLTYTKSFSPFAKVEFKENGMDITVEYCQPKKKGREIFGKLVPYDKVWRTGANQSTTIRFEKDTKIADKTIPKGSYSLFTIPAKDKWIIIINKTVGDWGAFSYKQQNDLLRTEVPVGNVSEVMESFTITFAKTDKGVNMLLTWDKTQIAVPFSL